MFIGKANWHVKYSEIIYRGMAIALLKHVFLLVKAVPHAISSHVLIKHGCLQHAAPLVV